MAEQCSAPKHLRVVTGEQCDYFIRSISPLIYFNDSLATIVESVTGYLPLIDSIIKARCVCLPTN